MRGKRYSRGQTHIGAGISLFLGVAAGVQAQAQNAAPTPGNASEPVIIVQETNTGTKHSEADKQLSKAVATRLESDVWVPAHAITAGAAGSAVVLTGKVETVLAKERAAELAGTVTGVQEVGNDVQLVVPQRADWEVQADVQNALRTNRVFSTDAVQTKVKDGVAILSGKVNSKHWKYLAETLAKSIPGVRLVENEIAVNLQADRSDEELREEVLSRIQWDPQLRNPQLSVHVAGGKVTVTGAVDSAKAKESLEKDAWVLGASSVDLTKVQVAPGVIGGFEGPLERKERLTPTGREPTP